MPDDTKALGEHFAKMAAEARDNIYKTWYQLTAWLVLGHAGGMAFILKMASEPHQATTVRIRAEYAIFLAGAVLAPAALTRGMSLGTQVGNAAMRLVGICSAGLTHEEAAPQLQSALKDMENCNRKPER